AAASLKLGGLGRRGGRRAELPRLYSRGLIEACGRPSRGPPREEVLPRLYSRGLIEAGRLCSQLRLNLLLPRLYSRGLIEARFRHRNRARRTTTSAALQPRPH